jgi:hypothetical protein
MSKDLKPFHTLRGLLKKYNLNYSDYANLIGLSQHSATLKLNGNIGFSISECKITRDYFRSRGETITVDELFID